MAGFTSLFTSSYKATMPPCSLLLLLLPNTSTLSSATIWDTQDLSGQLIRGGQTRDLGTQTQV